MNKIPIVFLVIIVITIIIFSKLVLCKGINMKCNHCYNNGSHFHLQDISIKHNHGPKKGNKFTHKMCKICMKNPGKIHYHIC